MKREQINKYFLVLFCLALFSGLILSLAVFIATYIDKNMNQLELCFSNACVQYFIDAYSHALKILEVTGTLCVGIVTIGGVIVALASYINAQKTSKFSNHLAYFTLFRGFVESEILKLDRLSIKTVNTFKLYNSIYPHSRDGDLLPSSSYINFINELNNVISRGNAQATSAIEGSFRYKPHQQLMKETLAKIGLEVQFMPRNDFHALESDILRLLNLINIEFCSHSSIPAIKQSVYS